MRPLWTGTIGFGLVTIPVKLYSATRPSELDLDMLDARDHARIRFQRVNENTGKEVPWERIVRAYDHQGRYVVLEDDDLRNAAAEKSDVIAIHEFVDETEVPGKTSGASGLHVYIPTGTRYTYDQLAPLGHGIMQVVNDLLPDSTTLVRSLSKRPKDQIYLDHLQNRQGQTLASVYSVRPRPGATVSTPLRWKEVRPGLDRQAFTLRTVPRRVDRLGDLFAPLRGHKGFALAKARKELERLMGA